jgi:hypothetical protein
VGRLFVDEQETTKPPSNPPVTPRLGNRCWGFPLFNEFRKMIHKIFSIDGFKSLVSTELQII